MRQKIIFFFIFVFFSNSLSIVHAAGYSKTLKKWSRSDRVFLFKELDAAILWNATLLTNELLSAQADRYAKNYDLPVNEREDFLNSLYKKRDNQVCFFVSFYSHNRHFNDLKNNQAHWDIRLQKDGVLLRPSRIEKINRATPLDEMFYPYLNPWSRGYFVWFETDLNEEDASTLSVYGPEASSQLTWP